MTTSRNDLEDSELIARQMLLGLICEKVGLTLDQTALCVTSLSKEELKDMLLWASKIVRQKKSHLDRDMLLGKITEMVCKHQNSSPADTNAEKE